MSVAEHHANIVPWQLACKRTGAVLKHVPLRKDSQEIDVQVSSARRVAVVLPALAAAVPSCPAVRHLSYAGQACRHAEVIKLLARDLFPSAMCHVLLARSVSCLCEL